MKAVVLHEYGGPDKLKYEDFPDPVAGPGEVLVRVISTSVNPVDWKIRSGALAQMFPQHFPAVPGRDLAGVVRAVGAGVSAFQPGDHVFALANATYAELCVVKAEELAKVPEGMDLAEAGRLPLVLFTGDQLIRYATELKPGETVMVAGAVGSVGRAAVHVAKKLGAHVYAGVRKSQVEDARGLGADGVVALDDKDALARLGFLDAVADTVGGTIAETLMGKVKPGGRFGTVVMEPSNAGQHPTVQVKRIGARSEPARLVELADDVQSGNLVIRIDRMLPLAEAGAAQTAAEKGGIGKILLLA